MEKNANYALVGLSTLILTVALTLFIVWIARVRINSEYDLYDIVFAGPVRGLTEGGEVHFNGIKVGEVIKIALDETNPNNVIARARITDNVPIRVDSYATLEPQGITGLNYVQISAGTATKQLLKAYSDARCDRITGSCIPRLGSQRSTISDLLEGGGTVLTRTIEALDQVNKVLSDQNVKVFSAALADAQAVTAELRDRKAIIADAQSAIQHADEAIQEITRLSASTRAVVDGDGRRAVKTLADASADVSAAAKETRAMVARLQEPAADFAANGLPQITATLIQLQTAAEALEHLVNEIESSPTGALGKAGATELKVKK